MVRLATNGFFRFCRKCFLMTADWPFHRSTYIKCPLCLSKMRTPCGLFRPVLVGCMVSADYWLADYPELRRTTQPSTIGGPLSQPGFCIFCSTDIISTGECKKDVTPLLTHWSYVFLALTLRCADCVLWPLVLQLRWKPWVGKQESSSSLITSVTSQLGPVSASSAHITSCPAKASECRQGLQYSWRTSHDMEQ